MVATKDAGDSTSWRELRHGAYRDHVKSQSLTRCGRASVVGHMSSASTSIIEVVIDFRIVAVVTHCRRGRRRDRSNAAALRDIGIRIRRKGGGQRPWNVW